MAKTGRLTRLTPEIQKLICGLLRDGQSVSHAADICGLDRRTIHGWREKGRKEKSGVFRDFDLAVRKAQAESVQMLVDVWRKTSLEGGQKTVRTTKFTTKDRKGNPVDVVETVERTATDWRAAMALLQSRFPETWARRVMQHEGIPAGGGSGGLVLQMVFDNGDGVEGKTLQADARVIDEQKALPQGEDAERDG